ncbi:MAG: NADP-dependent malic enzyme [Planctomycetota bacterium]
MSDYASRSLELHKAHAGKLEIAAKVPLQTRDDLSLAYTPGVAEPCKRIADDPGAAYELTPKGNTVAIVSDGSAVLGLGNIGGAASIPVMEGKALLFKAFAGLDAWPICLTTQDPGEIIETVRRIAPVFGGVNLEDIAAPHCFQIEDELQDLGIPVFHDDQHGTAIVTLAGLLNAAKVVGKKMEDLKVVIVGAGAAGTAISKLLRCVNFDPYVCVPVADIIVCDSKGAIHARRTDLNPQKQQLLAYTNRTNREGSVHDVLEGADVFVGVSKGGLLSADDVKRMNTDPIIFAMANPDPEIMPDVAREAGAAVVGTGRSDFPNQVNNVLAFPGIFRGAIDARAPRITPKMKLAAAQALAECVPEPSVDKVIPDPLDKTVAPKVAEAVKAAAATEG